MKLALALGWHSVENMLDGLTFKELKMWSNYFSIEPFPEERADFRMANLMALMANINRKKGTQAYAPQDFMPQFREIEQEPTRRKSSDQLMHMALLINNALGGKVVSRSEMKQ